jgi:predicted esterase
MAHGTQDPVVPYPLGDESRRLLESAVIQWNGTPTDAARVV